MKATKKAFTASAFTAFAIALAVSVIAPTSALADPCDGGDTGMIRVQNQKILGKDYNGGMPKLNVNWDRLFQGVDSMIHRLSGSLSSPESSGKSSGGLADREDKSLAPDGPTDGGGSKPQAPGSAPAA